MTATLPDQLLGVRAETVEQADAVIVPLPFERTVTYGKGTRGAPDAILRASCQIETFDEEAGIDFEEFPRLFTVPAIPDDTEGPVAAYLELVTRAAEEFQGRFVLSLGGEHTVTYGASLGLTRDVQGLTIVHVDAHADLIDRLHGKRWSHGTVMRRLWEKGCRLIQIGVRSLSREEYDFCRAEQRMETFFAHQLPDRWGEVLKRIGEIEGEVYLSLDVDGLDPGVIPSTGTPQPDGLSWRQTMEIISAVSTAPSARFIGSDVVEFVPSPDPPGCDIIAAKLATKVLAFWGAANRGPA